MKKLKEWAEDWGSWKTIAACIIFFCGLAIGAENHFAKADTVKQLQMNLNYSTYQTRLNNLTSPYMACCDSEGKYFIDYKKMPKEVYQQVQWLESEIIKLEKQMGLRK